MPAAIAIPLIIGAASTAATVYSAKKQSDAAKQAATTQATASTTAANRSDAAMNQALDFTRQNQLATAQSYAPYIQTGQNALSKLSSGLGLPSQPMQAMPTTPGQGSYQMYPPQQGPMMQMNAAPQMNALSPKPPSAGMTSAPPQGITGQGGGMVMLQAPTGETRAVPAAQAEALIARGARRVN